MKMNNSTRCLAPIYIEIKIKQICSFSSFNATISLSNYMIGFLMSLPQRFLFVNSGLRKELLIGIIGECT